MIDRLFCERMRGILGEEYDAFLDSLLNSDAVKGIRVNGCKLGVDEFLEISSLAKSKIPYTEDGFYPITDEGLGNTPEHHAGMIYVQDPGAMAPMSAIEIKKGDWVADLCSAPGGKSAQAASAIGPDGFLLANEYVPKRAKLIVGNFERLGIKCGMVTSMDTGELTKLFRHAFDLVICDVPCSGEGMFRKSEDAREMWSVENVQACAARQREILRNGAALVKGGGAIVYSTCTWSTEENEEIIKEFLRENPCFRLESPKKRVIEYTSAAVSDEEDISSARRFYPHIAPGEGQFLAILRKDNIPEDKQTILYKDSTIPLNKEEKRVVDKFISDNFITPPPGRVVKIGESIVLISHGCPIPKRGVFMGGVLFGEIKGTNLFPSHQLFSAYGKLFKSRLNLRATDARVSAYLKGEEIPSDADTPKGWCAVLYEGVPLGGGKASSGTVKNHYPKGLRLKG